MRRRSMPSIVLGKSVREGRCVWHPTPRGGSRTRPSGRPLPTVVAEPMAPMTESEARLTRAYEHLLAQARTDLADANARTKRVREAAKAAEERQRSESDGLARRLALRERRCYEMRIEYEKLLDQHHEPLDESPAMLSVAHHRTEAGTAPVATKAHHQRASMRTARLARLRHQLGARQPIERRD